MSTQKIKSFEIILLTFIFGIALLLRLWGINFGLPYIYHYDEHFYIATALKLGSGFLNNPNISAPTGFANILFGEYAVYFLIGKIFGFITSVREFEAAYRSDPSTVYLIGRMTSAFFGAATVLPLFYLSKSIFSLATGFVSSLFLTVSFLHVRDSHYSVPDISMAFFVFLAVTLAAIALQRDKPNYLYMAGVAGGLAIATKWTALPVIVPLWFASTKIDKWSDTVAIRRLLTKSFFFLLLFVVLGFSLGAAQILINPAPYLNEVFKQQDAAETGGFDLWQVDTLPGWLFYGKTLLYGIGTIPLVLGIVGLFWLLKRVVKDRDNKILLIISFPLIYFLLMGSTRHYFARYALPLLPFMALFAAEAINMASKWIKTRTMNARVGWVSVTILVIMATIQPLVNSIRHNYLLSRLDTRTLAKQWIETNIPDGAFIGLDREAFGPSLFSKEYSGPHSKRTYNLTYMRGEGLSKQSIDWYREQGYDYLVASSFIYEIPLVRAHKDPARRLFYSSLDHEFELVQEFRPYDRDVELPFIFDEIYGPVVSLWQRERPGPTLKIYKVTH